MVVGTCTIELHIPGNHELKGKRRVLKSIIAHVRQEFNVSIAEVGGNDAWQSATLGLACVSNDAAHAHEVLTKIVAAVQNRRFDAQVIDYHIEIL
jgi:uncharacterized protein YlxP (DUF503 family)